jgi:ABC-type lipoprotein release transport system permease subunit
LGAIFGFLVGNGLALTYAPAIFKVTAKMIQPVFELLFWSIIAAPLFASVASLIPAMIAITQDPAVTLREE